MTSILEIEEAIERLPQEQQYDLAKRLSQTLNEKWDQQIESDIAAGKLDAIAQQALAEHRLGKSTPFPSDAE